MSFARTPAALAVALGLTLAVVFAAITPGCGSEQSVSDARRGAEQPVEGGEAGEADEVVEKSRGPLRSHVPDIGVLEEVGELYLSSYNVRKTPPTSMSDLARADDFVVGADAIKNGEIIVYWGVTPTPMRPSTVILAYKADVPTRGGYVLLKDMTAKSLSADEFQEALKPDGPTSADRLD